MLINETPIANIHYINNNTDVFLSDSDSRGGSQ